MRWFVSLLALLTFSAVSASAAPLSDSSTYPLSTCVVSGETLGEMGKVTMVEVGDRQIKLCCERCVEKFEGDQDSYVARLDKLIVEAQLATYPLETCPVSGEPLGTMGDPVDFLVGNRLVRLCCASCEKSVTEDPTKAIAALDEAVVEAQLAHYTATSCPISGGELGGMGEPVNRVFAGQLVRLCCAGCIKDFDADPVSAVAKLAGSDTGSSSARGQDAHHGHNH